MNDRARHIVSWWESLSEDDRTHARACASRGEGDARLAASLQRAGLGLVSGSWDRLPDSWARYIPPDVRAFLRSRYE